MRKSVLDALFPRIRQAVLAAFLLHPEKWWFLSDLAKHLGVTPSSLQRELLSLTQAGILEKRIDGNRKYYRANAVFPGKEELQSLLIKTIGIADVVWSAFKTHMSDIDIAFIYGSIARSEAIGTSDVDVIIIGSLRLSSIAASLRKAERQLGREINPIFYSRREYAKKCGEGFIKTVIADKKIFLKGSESELEALAS